MEMQNWNFITSTAAYSDVQLSLDHYSKNVEQS